MSIDPTGILLGLTDCLQHVAFDALAKSIPIVCVVQGFRRPSSDQSLVEQIFVIRRRSGRFVDQALVPAVEALPLSYTKFPLSRYLRQYVDPGAHVLRAFGVMRTARQHGVRPGAQTFLVGRVKLRDGRAESMQVAAHV